MGTTITVSFNDDLDLEQAGRVIAALRGSLLAAFEARESFVIDVQKPAQIEFIHEHDAHYNCSHTFFVNGVELVGYGGQGVEIAEYYTECRPYGDFRSWISSAADQDLPDASPAVRSALRRYYTDSWNAQFIDGWPEDDAWKDHLDEDTNNSDWWKAFWANYDS
jgi:hypothetical protein